MTGRRARPAGLRGRAAAAVAACALLASCTVADPAAEGGTATAGTADGTTAADAPCALPAVTQRPDLPASALPRAPLTRVPAVPGGWGTVATDDAVWVGGADSAIVRVDAGTARVTERVRLSDSPGRQVVAVGAEGQVWGLVVDSSNLIASADRIDPRTGERLHHLSLDSATPRVSLLVGSGAGMWYLSSDAAVLTRIDPVTGAHLATIDLAPPGTHSYVAAGFSEAIADESGVWVTMPYDGTLIHVDAETDAVLSRTCVASAPDGPDRARAYLPLGLGHGSVWVSDPAANAVVRVEAETGQVTARIPLPANGNPNPRFPGAVGALMWVPSGFEAYAIDPGTNTVVTGIRMLAAPSSGSDTLQQVVAVGDDLWSRERAGLLVRASGAATS